MAPREILPFKKMRNMPLADRTKLDTLCDQWANENLSEEGALNGAMSEAFSLGYSIREAHSI